MGKLPDDDLDRALEAWRVPGPPPEIEARTLAAYRGEFRAKRGWRGWFGMRVAVPLPLLVAVLAGIVSLSLMVLRLEAVRSEPPDASWGGLQPVSELRPEIIRSQHEAR